MSNNFKYGQEVLVKLSCSWNKRFFILESNGKFLATTNDDTIRDFEKKSFCCWWDECKAIPKTVYIPFDEVSFEEHRDKWFLEKNSKRLHRSSINTYGDVGIWIGSASVAHSWKEFFNLWTFEDCSPCGLEVNGDE